MRQVRNFDFRNDKRATLQRQTRWTSRGAASSTARAVRRHGWTWCCPRSSRTCRAPPWSCATGSSTCSSTHATPCPRGAPSARGRQAHRGQPPGRGRGVHPHLPGDEGAPRAQEVALTRKQPAPLVPVSFMARNAGVDCPPGAPTQRPFPLEASRNFQGGWPGVRGLGDTAGVSGSLVAGAA
ncbi:hypothetical protein D7X12_13480 [Corallococcus sicarius]|uniref:Uncharacterized protein n=1 Tax=Corallococcus sicarius TaxID=2316726 RepID=A0A3A8NHB1_9BACT|nr:hypothetical protein D7X12_13480 [Corallococcus sicarius]